MPSRTQGMHLGEVALRGQRHVCGAFDGPGDAASVLVRFVVEGLERGDRVIHLVEDRGAYLRRLSKRVNISTAVESGQLDVRTWDETYLRDGGFSESRMRAYMRRTLRDGLSSRFPAMRLIGDMDWALDAAPRVDELVAYESWINSILARPRVAVVCAYDARRHSSTRMSAIIDVHAAALVGGRLQPTPGQTHAPRERIMAAAATLFAENGVGATGVDTLIEGADVAKATFYRHFPSKEALIVAWLRDRRTRWFDAVTATAEGRAATPSDVVPRLFEAVAEWLETDDFVGCPYLNTAFEISDPAHPARDSIREALAEIGDYLEERAAAAGQLDAAQVGRELHALLAGSISLAVANRSSSYAIAARDAAIELLDAAR